MLSNTENITSRSLEIFVYICITREKVYHFSAIFDLIVAFPTVIYKYMQTLYGCIVCILQHFESKPQFYPLNILFVAVLIYFVVLPTCIEDAWHTVSVFTKSIPGMWFRVCFLRQQNNNEVKEQYK